MYKVIKFFTDLKDNEHPYNVGDVFPREGVEVTDARFAELASDSNRQGVPLIELVEEPAEPEKEEETVVAEPEKEEETVVAEPEKEEETVVAEPEKEEEKPKKKTSKK